MPSAKRLLRNLLIGTVVLVVGLGSVGLWGTRYGQALRASTEGFAVLDRDERVYYMPSMETEAERVAAALPEAIRQVESLHGRRFLEPISVFVCDTQACFNQHVPRGTTARGAVFLKRVFLAPRTFHPPSEAAILTHELDHLFWHQHLGMIAYVRELPTWFQEGMAVFVSEGGGAEPVSEAEARAALLQGRTFVPEERGSLWVPQTAGSYGLPHHLFYRQSAMFVAYLHDHDPDAFQQALEAIVEGASFAEAFASTGRTITQHWADFVAVQQAFAGS